MRRIRLPDTKTLRKELVRREAEDLKRDFKAFVKEAWPIVEPGVPFHDGMHIDALCAHLQACYERKILKLLINVPPRTGKSTIVSVLFPAWVWANDPAEKFLSGSYALQLATRDAVRMRRVVESDWYRARWGDVELADDQNQKTSFENTKTGTRQVVAVGSATTGLGGTFLICDDPHNVQQAESAIMREAAVTWFREAWSTRANTPTTVRIVVMQRVHQSDVAGFILGEGDWVVLKLPMRYEAGPKVATPIGWVDPREEDGALLWPDRYGEEEIAALEKTLGSAATASQLQQRPAPRGGGTFRREWYKFWYDDRLGIPEPVVVQDNKGGHVECVQKALPKIDETSLLASWDLAFKGGEKNDYVVGQVWGRGVKGDRANHYLLDQERGQYDFPATIEAMYRLRERNFNINTIVVEEKANGAAAIATLKNDVPGIVAVDPEGGKESRASAAAPLFEAGNVWLPHPDQFPWVTGYMDEMGLFPRGSHDDQVDATTQALSRMKQRVIEEIDPAVFDFGFRVNPWR
jgi:predicted phage terminase large subunit-like protein